MQRIVIKNFGPISNAEIEIKKTVVLIGENAIGKSTTIKLMSTFLWMEKALFRGAEKEWFEKENRFKNFFLPYHRIKNFLKQDSIIEYYGQAYTIKYSNEKISIENQTNNRYRLPKIMYVPAERNFLTYLRTTKDLKSEGVLQDFEGELFKAENNLKGTLSLPLGDFEIEYNKRHEMLYVKNKSHKIKITEAASGLQSSVPLYLVSDYLSKLVQNNGCNDTMTSGDIREFEKKINVILNDKDLSEKQKHIAISALSNQFNKKAFINIIEEPEQNLSPVFQMRMIKSLVSICNRNEDNQL
jgi:predicted ATPase